jgi:hypothetical protein
MHRSQDRCQGVDLSQSGVAWAREVLKVPATQGTLYDLQPTLGEFDVVTFWANMSVPRWHCRRFVVDCDRRHTRVIAMSVAIRIVAVSFLLAGTCRAQVTLQETPESITTACRQVVAGFMTALEKGDASALRLYIHADRRVAAQQMGLGALIDCIVSQRDLERTMTAKWGSSSATRIAGLAAFSKEDREAVARAQVQLEADNEALLVLSPSVSPVVLHRSRFDRRWRVQLATLTGLYDGFEHSPSARSFKRIRHLQAVAEALQIAGRQVQQEKLTNPADTRAAVQKMIESSIQRMRAQREGRIGARR